MKKHNLIFLFSIIFFFCLFNLVIVVPDGVPDSLDRGHRIILERGFQLQTLMFPGAYPAGQSWSAARWSESHYNTPNLHEWGNPATFGAAPGIPWSRWMWWDGCVATNPYLHAHEIPYLPNLISLQAGDERDLGNSSVVNTMKMTFDIWENTYPDIIRYTSQHGLDGANFSTHQNYQSIAKPDMVNMFVYEYKDGEGIKGGSQPKWYEALGKYRLLGLYGNDGTGNTPVPASCFYQCFIHEGARNMGLTELSASQYAPLVFGYKFTIAFFYNDPNPGVSDLVAQIFYGDGDQTTNVWFGRAAENNKNIRRITPALERLISRSGASINYVWVKPGQYDAGWLGTKDNPTPGYCAEWHSGVDPYMTSVSANNPSGWNDGLRGDTYIGYFHPLHESFDGPDYNNELYFMIMNGLTSVDASPGGVMQQITLNFDFGTSGITNLLRLSRNSGKPEVVNLIHDGGSAYHITLEINGGEADLFKYNDGAPFVGNVDAPENIFPTNFAAITAPATFSATPFKSGLGYSFSASQWQISTDSSFSVIAGDTGEIIPLESFTAPANTIPAGTYYWRVRYKNSAGIWSGWSLEPTSFTISSASQTKTIFKDRFSVISSGDANHQYNIAGRQSGNAAPLIYNCKGGPSTVSVSGPNVGKCHMDGTTQPAYLSPYHNFTESGDFSIKYDITRFPGENTQQWNVISFGTDDSYKIPHEISGGTNHGMEIVMFEHGWYHVYVNNIFTANYYFSELEYANNPTLKIKITVSQNDFSGSGNAEIAMFINGKPYPLSGGHVGLDTGRYIYTFAGGFTNNFITFVTDMYNPGSSVDIDNFKVLIPTNSFSTLAWSNDLNSEISDYKTYTHTVNFGDNDDVLINNVTFTGVGANMSGGNWEINTASANPLTGPIDVYTDPFFKNPNIAPYGVTLVSNVMYSALNSDCASLTLTGLSPGKEYLLTLYSFAFESVGLRKSFFAASDDSLINTIDQNEFDFNNGQLLKYKYIAPDNGVFSFSSTPDNSVWGWYAFSNEEYIPEPFYLSFIIYQLLLINYLRNRKSDNNVY